MGMTRRPLGQTDLLLSPIGLGTVKIGRNTDVKYPEGFELPSDRAVHFHAFCRAAVEFADPAR